MPADPNRVAAARVPLDVTVADLQRGERPPVPTMAEYLPQVTAGAGPGARRTYGSYWRRMAQAWGDRPLDTIAASDNEAIQHQTVAVAGRGVPVAVAGTPASMSSRRPAPSTTGPSLTA